MDWYSHHLGGNIKMLVFGESGYPVVLFPTTMGRYYECRDFKLIESARWFVEQGLIQIFCPDSINDKSWYDKKSSPGDRIWRHTLYDRFLREELIEKLRHNSPTGKVAVAGPSFGGYLAANFAFKHPDVVSHLLSMSGSFDIKSFMDGYYDDKVYFNNPVDYLPDANHPDLWNMNIVLGTSQWDICRPANEQLSGILHAKGIDHWLDMRGWVKHDWPLWREMFPHYLSLIKQ